MNKAREARKKYLASLSAEEKAAINKKRSEAMKRYWSDDGLSVPVDIKQVVQPVPIPVQLVSTEKDAAFQQLCVATLLNAKLSEWDATPLTRHKQGILEECKWNIPEVEAWVNKDNKYIPDYKELSSLLIGWSASSHAYQDYLSFIHKDVKQSEPAVVKKYLSKEDIEEAISDWEDGEDERYEGMKYLQLNEELQSECIKLDKQADAIDFIFSHQDGG